MNNRQKYNPQIHHRRSIRLRDYDYSQAGLYFITICCQNRKCIFGKIENHEMVLNEAGKIADECWQDIPNHFPNAVLHEYVIMPNHIHGIIELSIGGAVGTDGIGAENFRTRQRNEFQKMIPRSIGSIVKGFKTGVTKWFRNNAVEIENSKFLKIWQRNYYEHIIRDEQSYQKISEYIINNPSKWKEDKFY